MLTGYVPLNLAPCSCFFSKCIKDLMYNPISPILDFYPLEFEQDLNGKKAEWEAIVKIPFIDEERLLKAMACGSRCIVFTFFCLTWPLSQLGSIA